MIYGHFGLANDIIELSIEIDYKSRSIDVFTDVARFLIKYGYINILSLLQFPKTFANEEGMGLLAFIGPDWTSIIRYRCGEGSQLINDLYSASRTSKVTV